MKNLKKNPQIIALFIFIMLALFSCKKEENNMNDELYNMASTTEGFTWYKLSNTLLEKSSGSGHNTPYLRTRYNKTASIKLDSLGKVVANAKFSDGSLIVKELFNADHKLESYAILYKMANNSNADAEGWVWAIINADKSVVFSAENRGVMCIECHKQIGNIDFTLMNNFFE